METPSVHAYLDYRSYLKDLFAYKKEQDPAYSYRCFSMRAGFASPNFLKLVMDGKRNLTNESIAKIAKGFGLKKQDREYFESLVYMNQASSHEERNHYYCKMMSLKANTPVRRLEKACYEYFSTWFYPAVREIVTFGGRDLSAREVAALLNPPISVKEAEKALKVLLDLGLIRKDADGRWEQCDRALSTGAQTHMLNVANFHREMIRLAGESIERYAAPERDISSLTLSIPHERKAQIIKRIVAFRRELLDFACEDDRTDQVVQVNFQLFPLTRPYKKENGQ
jgi:uncharacterized protein (TIGR02147 family)